MNGDQVYAEILASIARIETSNKQLIEQMSEICKFKLEMIKTVQEFNDYKKSRFSIPEDLQELKDVVTAHNMKCDQRSEQHDSIIQRLVKENTFLMTWYGRAASVIVAIQILIAVMVAVGRYVDIQYVLK